MVKILTFPERQLTSASVQHVADIPDFLVFDSDGTLSFSKVVSERPDHSVAQPDVCSDWTNQELASIYRVKHLLDAAQIPTQLDRGLSDEGEPWCVFCTLEADVFIHLCRIDGLYWLDSPKLPAPLNGLSFDELVQGFIILSEQGKQISEDSRKIVRFQKNNSVFLHPSVMLAALVWSLYFGSDELLIPRAHMEGEDTPEQNPGNSWSLLDDDLAHNSLENVPAENSEKIYSSVAMSLDEYKTTAVSSTNFPFSMMLGLGSIAVASGLILENEWRDIVLSLLPGDDGEERPSAASSDAETSNTLVSMLLQSMDILVSFVVQEDDDTGDAALINPEADFGSSDLIARLVELANLLEGGRSESEAGVQRGTGSEASISAENLQEFAVLEGIEGVLAEVSVDQVASDATPKPDVVLGLVDYFLGSSSLTTINMDGTTYWVDLSFGDFAMEGMELVEQVILDAETNENLVLSEDWEHDQAAWDASDVLPFFDQSAKEFVFGLLEHSDSMEFLLFQKDLVFFDVAAYQSGEERVQMSWSTGDGGTVSLLGAKSDFLEFGFI